MTHHTVLPTEEASTEEASTEEVSEEVAAPAVELQPGLERVVLSETRLSRVDGEGGELILAGYPLEEIAPRATYEEMVFLLWTDRLPDAEELRQLHGDLASRREIPATTLDLLRQAARRAVLPMDALRMAVASLELCDDPPPTRFEGEALSLVARLPALVAAYARLRGGAEPIAPRFDLGTSASLLYQIHGEVPEEAAVRALDTYLATVIDHGANASTFAARVIVSTRSDLISAVVGALGALKGPLHGGAPGPALDMVFEIATPERAEPVLRAKLAAGERLMGFGHRVYKVRDPRAQVLGQEAERLFGETGDRTLYDLVRHVEKVALALLAEHKPGRRLETNVEFYTALLLHGLGFKSDLFTPIFAVGRGAGWIAHCREQQALDRLIRPRLHYVGEVGRTFIELPQRTAAVVHP